MFVLKEQCFIESGRVDWTDLGGGVRRKITAYNDAVMAVYVEFRKGAVGALHQHPHAQITYIQSGAFVVRVEALEDSVLVDFFAPMREDFVPHASVVNQAAGARES